MTNLKLEIVTGINIWSSGRLNYIVQLMSNCRLIKNDKIYNVLSFYPEYTNNDIRWDWSLVKCQLDLWWKITKSKN